MDVLNNIDPIIIDLFREVIRQLIVSFSYEDLIYCACVFTVIMTFYFQVKAYEAKKEILQELKKLNDK